LKKFPENIQFKYPWRKYQQEALDQLQEHLSNQHLHVIAPPGSGKTVLGLEVALRLNQPTLILAPTLAIRNQWIQRFCELFLQIDLTPDWISRDIRNPKFMTVVTYQGLHAACNHLKITEIEQAKEESDEVEIFEEEEEKTPKNKYPNLENIIKVLKAQNIKTIVIDEAHHLKNEWWQTLIKVKEALSPVVVGLTATPPYDVSATEWQRYLEMNGPVDTEISVPQLVIEGDLCPHQDYIYFTTPTENENQKIHEFRLNVENLFFDVKTDKTLLEAIETHPIWVNPMEYLEWIYGNLSFYSASLIFLNANEREISESHLEIIGDKDLEIPVFDYHWMEILLNFYLYKDKEHFTQFKEHQKSMEMKLKRCDTLERKQINLEHNQSLRNSLTASISKLQGIQDIVNFEYAQLGNQLRLVILSDYIRKEFIVQTPQNHLEINKMGVMSIFEKLRRENRPHKKLGVLTGSIVIIPQSAYPSFQAKALRANIQNISHSPLAYDSNYILVHQTEQIKHKIVDFITQIFEEGEIEVLIGTKSLLGEGWDAPAINSLILASFVGSFVLSNQMRGRAIRVQNENLSKTGNVWHLACIDPTSSTGGDDFELLKRRFKSFVGVSLQEELSIENGIDRLNIPKELHLKSALEAKNQETFKFAADRESLKQRWVTALESGIQLVEEIKIPYPQKEEKSYTATKQLYYKKTIRSLMMMLGSGLFSFTTTTLNLLAKIYHYGSETQAIYWVLPLVGLVGVVSYGVRSFRVFHLYLKYRDITKDIEYIGMALLESLKEARIIKTPLLELRIEASVDNEGAIYCHLEGGSTFEKSMFISALQEILMPIDNPRYVIKRKSTALFFIKQEDYHAVPEVIGRNKNLASYFEYQWSKYVGDSELIFTRNIEGRKLLLKSRLSALSAQFESSIEHVNKWT
jgi:superfamily II DNA or RNA helicase